MKISSERDPSSMLDTWQGSSIMSGDMGQYTGPFLTFGHHVELVCHLYEGLGVGVYLKEGQVYHA